MIGNFTLIQLLLLGLLPIVLFIWIGLTGVLAIKRHWVWAGLLAAPAIVAPFWLWIFVFHPFGPVERLRVLDEAVISGNTKLVLTQSRNGDWREPYTIYCWIKPPDRPWGNVLIDFESSWWRSGDIRTSGTQARIFRGGRPELTLFLQGHTFRVDDEEEEPMEPLWMEPGWEPRDGGEFREALDRAHGARYVPPKRVHSSDSATTTTT